MNAQLIDSIGFTLLHSLWQFTMIYVLLRILLKIFRHGSSQLRYNLSGGALLMSFVCSLLTFAYYYNQGTGNLPAAEEWNGNEILLFQLAGMESVSVPEGPEGLTQYLPYMVFGYFIVVILLAMRLVLSLLYIRKLKNFGLIKTSEKIDSVFSALVRKFDLNKKISILQSVIVKVPMVIGYLKPVVIVPAGTFTQLPYNQIEAILAHELAHIQRNDFLINILQSVVELLFFYHPAIYQISKHIRAERENCCDDIALNHCGDTAQYVKALASMEGIVPSGGYYAVAFVNQKNTLLKRIKRILKPNVMKTKLTDRIMAGIIILAGFFTIVLTASAALNNISGEHSQPLESIKMQQTGFENFSSVSPDTIIDFDANRIVTHRKNEKGEKEKIEMKFSGGKLTELTVNGEIIPEEDYPQYNKLIAETKREVTNASVELEKAEKELESINEEEIAQQIEQALEEARSINHEEIRMEMEKARTEIEKIDQEEIRREVEMAMEEARRELENAKLEYNSDSVRMEIDRAMESIDWEEIQRSIEEAMKDAEMSSEEISKAMEEAHKAMKEINWEEIQRSIDEGMKAAESGLNAINWDLIAESIELSLDITADVLDNIAIEIESSMKEIDHHEIEKNIRDAKAEVKKEKKELNELEDNMEKALEELEKK